MNTSQPRKPDPDPDPDNPNRQYTSQPLLQALVKIQKSFKVYKIAKYFSAEFFEKLEIIEINLIRRDYFIPPKSANVLSILFQDLQSFIQEFRCQKVQRDLLGSSHDSDNVIPEPFSLESLSLRIDQFIKTLPTQKLKKKLTSKQTHNFHSNTQSKFSENSEINDDDDVDPQVTQNESPESPESQPQSLVDGLSVPVSVPVAEPTKPTTVVSPEVQDQELQNKVKLLQSALDNVKWQGKTNHVSVNNIDSVTDTKNGDNVLESHNKMLKVYQQSAGCGDSIGMRNIGSCFKHGTGVDKNYKSAMYWYKKAAAFDDPDACYHVGILYENGFGVPEDPSQAQFWFNKGRAIPKSSIEKARKKVRTSIDLLNSAHQHEYGQGRMKNLKTALKFYKASAKYGNSTAMVSIGEFYHQGKGGVRRDEKTAIEWYKKAAKEDNPFGMSLLGNIYYARKDYPETLIWCKQAAALGESQSMTNIGTMYVNGDGVSQSFQTAMKWYKKASDIGSDIAMVSLGNIYGGFYRNYDEAFKLYRKAAEKQHPEAMFHLGAFYSQGVATRQSWPKAVQWLTKSAELGYGKAMFQLGSMYAQGQGVPKNASKSTYWFKKAERLGVTHL